MQASRDAIGNVRNQDTVDDCILRAKKGHGTVEEEGMTEEVGYNVSKPLVSCQCPSCAEHAVLYVQSWWSGEFRVPDAPFSLTICLSLRNMEDFILR